MSEKILEAKNISKYFHDPLTIQVLKDINFSINKSEFVAVTGRSGCGKSTLLYILSTMDTDYQGELLIDGVSMGKKKEGELAIVRNEKIGFVFQFHYLLNEFSVLRNENSEIVFNIFQELSQVYHQSLLIVTHDNDCASRTNRIIEMEDWKIIKM
ncbi:MAG: ATP-binding cassette domain-containing protein [Bacteroidetes bacterium]|nr:ATP-binding cassette domain-containing protein [Bacteroidota bacterium]